ncbi:MAG: hypothetical protein ACJ8DZ_01730 [Allosphingosinicella sp.]
MQAAIPLMVAGQLVQGVAGYSAGRASAKADEANATGEEQGGADQAARIRDSARLAMGSQIGAQAESGFAIGTGSALSSLRESAINAELDVLNVRRQAASRAAAYRARAAQEKRGATMGLIGSLVGAAGTVAGARADYANARGPVASPPPGR